MKTSKGELKKLMKEAIREVFKEEMKTILREAVFSKGALSDIIAESVSGVTKAQNGSQKRSKTMQESQDSSKRKRSQNPTSKLGDKFKEMFNGKDITEGTTPASDPGTPVNAGGGGAASQSPGQINSVQQAEQMVRNMKGAGAGAMKQSPQNQQQLQQQQPQSPDNAMKNHSQPSGHQRMRVNKDIAEKLKNGERSSVMKKGGN